MALIIMLLFFSMLIMFFGIYMILASFLRFPKISTDVALQTLARQKKTSKNEVVLYALARKLSRFIRINYYKKQIMELALREANIPLSPEAYVAKSILVSSIFAIAVIPFLYIMPIVSAILFIMTVWFYFKQMNDLNKMILVKKEIIEGELPRFVATIAEQIKYSKNVINILDNYRKYTSGVFLKELETTIADMKTGQLETALLRLEARINSSMLSEVVRGLIGVVRGDDNVVYFELLANKLKLQEVQKLKSIAIKKPIKLRKYTYAVMVAIVITYLVIMFMQMVKDLSILF